MRSGKTADPPGNVNMLPYNFFRRKSEKGLPLARRYGVSDGGTDRHATGHCEGATGNAVIIEKRLPAAA